MLKRQGAPFFGRQRRRSLPRVIAERLEDRTMLSVVVPALRAQYTGPVATPQAVPFDFSPIVVTPASATPSPVTGLTTNLTVLGDDDAGESTLTYTWVTLGTPPAPVGFSDNGTNTAKNTVVTFTQAGSYSFQVTLTDGSGLTATSSTSVTVNQTATSVAVTSTSSTVAAGASTQLSATELDQFGIAMVNQLVFTWSVSNGGGSVNAAGLYTAAATAGSATINATDTSAGLSGGGLSGGGLSGGGLSGSAVVSIVTPVVWYQMNATSGTALTDSSGNNQTGTLSGTTGFVSGVTGNALNLPYGNATLPAGIVKSLTDFTITAWVNIPALVNSAQIFDFGTGTNVYMHLTADAASNNGLQFGITTSGSANEQQVNGPAISAGVWTHIAITLAGTTATLYVNGSSVAAGTITLNPSSLGSTTLNYLGKSQFSTDPLLAGSIDDFRIYGSALSAEQVQQVASFYLPSGWTDSDIGSPGVAGSALYIPSSATWTVNGGGTDIFGNADQFNFAYTTLSGDLVLTAEVTNIGATDPSAEAGLMIRSSTDPGSVDAALLMTPSDGIYFDARGTTDDVTGLAQRTGITGPVWLQLDRYDSFVSAYFSNNDVNWYPIGSPGMVPLGTQVVAGLAVSAHNNSLISGASFSSVSVAANAAPTIVTAAAATPSTFTGYSTNLSVLAADDAGEKNLTYTWATTGTPPAAVSFSANATNAAKSTQATFTASGTYNLAVTVSDVTGLSTVSNVVVTVSVPPLPPVGVTAQWNGSGITISWQATAGAVSYNIYRATAVGGEGSAALFSNITTSSYVDSTVTAGTSYYYEVTAVNGSGLESGRSFEAAAMTGSYTTPIISEFMASNNSTLADASGSYPDWLELYNPTTTTATLTGDYLTNSTKTLNLWPIPAATLAPGAFMVVFADSENTTDFAGGFHTNFNIGASGGYLALVASNGTTVLSSYTFGQQVSDIAYGVGMAQTGSIISFGGDGFLTPTPGAINGPVIATGIASAPTFNYPSGFYSNSLQLTISSATAGASIYYTLDGTAPSPTNGTLYTGTMTISGESTFRAMAIAPNYLNSTSTTASYIYLSQVLNQSANGQPPPGWPVDWGFSLVHYGMDPTVVDNPLYGSEIKQDLLDLPSVSLLANVKDLFDPTTGIYSESQISKDHDIAASIELINPGGAAGFQADVGVSLKGDSSALFPNFKHGFDIHFSSEYGISELNYPVFGPNAAQSFEEIQLRTDQNNSWSINDPQNYLAVRDEFTSSLLAATGEAAEHYKICFLYVDGMFWGLYDIIEKPNDDFAASYYGESASDYDVIKATDLTATAGGAFGIEAEDGTLSAWNQLYTDLSTLDLSSNANYEMLQGNNPDGTKNAAYPDLLDVNNLINYMLVITYTGNYDGPYSTLANGPNNFYAIRPTDGSFGFRFVATDSEVTLLGVDESSVNISPTTLTSSITATPAYFFDQLEANADFRVAVGDAVQKNFFNGGPMSVPAATQLFNTLVAEVQGPVVGESARWGDALRPGDAYTRDNDWQPLVNSMLSGYFPYRTLVAIEELQNYSLYPFVAPPIFNQYGGSIPSGFQLTMSLVGGGTIYYTLDGTDPQNADGSLSTTAVAYTGGISLFTTTEVKARVLSGTSWSALIDESFVAAASSLRITQLDYDPGKPPSGSTYNNDDFEFVELENYSSIAVNLTGVAFTDGITYTFGDVTLGPGQSGVLVHNLAAFESRYGTMVNVLGNYLSTGQSFSNSGEDVELVDAAGNVLDHFDYTPCIAAYPTAHGKGASLVAIDPDGPENLNLAASWKASTVTNGTVPVLLGSTPAYVLLDATGLYIDIWNTATDIGSPAESLLIANVPSITFDSQATGDSLTVDFSNGNPLAAVPLFYNGGTTPSLLNIIGTTGADTFTVNGSTGTLSSAFGSGVVSYFNPSDIAFTGNGGADTLTQNAQPGGTTTLSFVASNSADTINVNGGTFPYAASTGGVVSVVLGNLNIAAGATFSLLSAATVGYQDLLTVNNLSIAGSIGAWTGKLDLGSNNLIVTQGDLPTIMDQLKSGFNNGGAAWAGSGGIVSSAAADNSRFVTTLTYENGGSILDGMTTTSNEVLVRYVYFGDTDFSGTVDGTDYSRIDRGYLLHLTGWTNGDFNYDGVVNGSDYTLIDNAYNNQSAPLTASGSSSIATSAAEIQAPASTKSISKVSHLANGTGKNGTGKNGTGNKTQHPSRASQLVAPLFQLQTPISFAESTEQDIDLLIQKKDLLDRLSAAP